MKAILVALLVTFSIPAVFAQDSTEVGSRMYSIKLDLTHNMLYRNAYNLSLERIMKPNQTLGITVGMQEFPKVLNLGENIEGKRSDNSGGYKVGAEYRFYLKKENKFAAPHGVYVGPYFSVLGFNTARDITYTGEKSPRSQDITQSLIFIVWEDNWGISLCSMIGGPWIWSWSARRSPGTMHG